MRLSGRRIGLNGGSAAVVRTVSGQGTIRKFEHFADVPVKIPMLHRYPASFVDGCAWGDLSKLFCVVVNFCALTFFAFVATVARGEPAEPKLHPEIRRALAQNFPYQPKIRAEAQEQSLPRCFNRRVNWIRRSWSCQNSRSGPARLIAISRPRLPTTSQPRPKTTANWGRGFTKRISARCALVA